MIDDRLVAAHRARALTPDRPVVRGTAQNPDVFFQNREAANTYYMAAPADRPSRDGAVRRRSPAARIGCSSITARPMPSASSS